METLIKALIGDKTARDCRRQPKGQREDAVEIIESMRQEIENGENIQDVLLLYDLDLDDAIDLFEI